MGKARDALASRVLAALGGVQFRPDGTADDELVAYAALLRRQRDEWQRAATEQARRATMAELETERLRERIAEALDPPPASGGD